MRLLPCRALAPLPLVLGLVLAACEDGPPAARDGLSFDVASRGPFVVGYRATTSTYDSPDGSGPRTIPIRVWYPVEESSLASLESIERPLYYIYRSREAVVGAIPARPAFAGGHPVVVHSHGHGGYPDQSYPIFEWLASNGFVVIAPGHVGNMLADILAPEYQERYAIHAERAHDVRHALDYLETLPVEDPLAGATNTTRVVVSGHSRGTVTVWSVLGAPVDLAGLDAACAAGDYDEDGGCPAAQRVVYAAGLSDPRVVAGIPMAGSGSPDFFGGYAGMNSVTAPVLLFSGGADPVGADQVFANVTTPPLTWLEYRDGCHELFGAAGSCGDVVGDRDEVERILGTYVTAFARSHLASDPDPTVAAVLDGTELVSERIGFHGR